jgi:hypothetical protein
LPQYIFLIAAVWLGLNPPEFFVNLINDSVAALPGNFN